LPNYFVLEKTDPKINTKLLRQFSIFDIVYVVNPFNLWM